MEQLDMAKQMMTFQKATYENCCDVLAMMHEQHMNVLDMTINQISAWLPAESKKAITDWLGQMNDMRSQFLQAVDENFHKFEGFFAADEAPLEKIPAKTKKS